jgi:hypothetical protein
MFLSAGLEQLDPALLAFVKCHVTSPVRWEVLRVLAGQTGEWVSIPDLSRVTRCPSGELSLTLDDLVADGVVDVLPTVGPTAVAYRLPANEPTSVVLQRLIAATAHSQELRGIIVAHLQRSRHQRGVVPTAAA